MNLLSANLQDLRELYVTNLEKALGMEEHVAKALPTTIAKASDPQLKQAFETHLEEVRGHMARIERLLQINRNDDAIRHRKVIGSFVS